MKRSVLYVLIMMTSLAMVMCTPKQETATEADSTVVVTDTVEAKADTTVVAVDSTEVK